MKDLVQKIYEAAANAGFLKECIWSPSNGGPARIETTMTYPAEMFPGLSPREVVEIEGVSFQVRQVHPAGDGSEMRAQLARVFARIPPSVPPRT